MTAAPPVDRAAASRLVAALEYAWAAIRTRHVTGGRRSSRKLSRSCWIRQ
jgi:hypothetical protein